MRKRLDPRGKGRRVPLSVLMLEGSEDDGPLQRVHGEDEFPGIGVGLATVQRIVRRHGGGIRGEGWPGGGATFSSISMVKSRRRG